MGRWKLLVIVGLSIVARVFTLWVGRAEFTGWLNHTYYYFVQVRGLLEQGALPYPDMPLLFWLYGGAARLLMAVGVDRAEAIVGATRLIMSVTPALVAVPVYGMLRWLRGNEALRRGQWLLVAVSAFLPLSLSYLPEFLQKNALGLVLLASFIAVSQRLLERGSARRLVAAAAVLALLIVLTHYGTTAALLLYAVALTGARIATTHTVRGTLSWCLALVGFSAAVLALIRWLDPQRFGRLFSYLGESLRGSLVAALWSESSGDVWASLLAVAALYAALVGCYRVALSRRDQISQAAMTFWLAQIAFCGLLFLPLFDRLLMGRFALFASLPGLLLLAHLEAYWLKRKAWRWAAGVAVAAGVLLLSVGELVSSRLHGRNHGAVAADLEAIGQSIHFGNNDLVLARTGADHVCNWYFGVKAGVITALTLDDFAAYDAIYVLNPRDGVASGALGGVATPAERYAHMRRNIPRPAGAVTVFSSERLEVLRLGGPPDEWLFDASGRWSGYAIEGESAP